MEAVQHNIISRCDRAGGLGFNAFGEKGHPLCLLYATSVGLGTEL